MRVICALGALLGAGACFLACAGAGGPIGGRVLERARAAEQGQTQPGGVSVERDIQYARREGAASERLSLDVYTAQATEPGDPPRPVVVYIHGGGWAIGDKSRVHAKPGWLVGEGFVFVSVNYRLSPEVQHPEHARDCASAVAWVREHAVEFGGDPERVFVMGHSAGAHLAAMLATDPSLLGEHEMRPDDLLGVVLLDGAAYDVNAQIASVTNKRFRSMYTDAFGEDHEGWPGASPTHHARAWSGPGAPPPTLGVYVNRESAPAQTKGLIRAIREAGGVGEVRLAPGKTHREINTQMGVEGDADTRAVLAFLRKRLG